MDNNELTLEEQFEIAQFKERIKGLDTVALKMMLGEFYEEYMRRKIELNQELAQSWFGIPADLQQDDSLNEWG